MPETEFGTEVIPVELLAAAVQEAEADAERTAIFLSEFCEAIDREHPGSKLQESWRTLFSAATLLELAAALKIMSWEQAKLTRPAMDLPAGQEQLRKVLLAVGNPDAGTPLSRQVMRTFALHFAWTARIDLGAEAVVLDAIDEASLAEQLANFLWHHRNS